MALGQSAGSVTSTDEIQIYEGFREWKAHDYKPQIEILKDLFMKLGQNYDSFECGRSSKDKIVDYINILV
jgi:hypothetical protein